MKGKSSVVRYGELVRLIKRGVQTRKALAQQLGLSSERVRQLLVAMPQAVREQVKVRKAIYLDAICRHCHKVWPCPSYKISYRRFCSRDCRLTYNLLHRKTRKESNQIMHQKRMDLYRTDAKFRRTWLDQQKKWLLAREAKDPAKRERRLALMRAHAQKLKTNP